MLHRIAHTTDFSRESTRAFHHALAMALAARCQLDLLHVNEPGEARAWNSFPHVRQVLVRWGLLDQQASPSDIDAKLGVHVSKIEIHHRDPQSGVSEFFHQHRPELMVVATHGREGANRWLQGSVTEAVVKRTHVPAMMIGPESRGFIDEQTGAMKLRRILFPLTTTPSPSQALAYAAALLAPLHVTMDNFVLLNVGDDVPDLLDTNGRTRRVEHTQGPVVETIVKYAQDRDIDLIAMPTAGHHGFLDAFRGSTTSRVLPHAPCPVLTLPIAAS